MIVEVGIRRIGSIDNYTKYIVFDIDPGNLSDLDAIVKKAITNEQLDDYSKFYKVPSNQIEYFINDMG